MKYLSEFDAEAERLHALFRIHGTDGDETARTLRTLAATIRERWPGIAEAEAVAARAERFAGDALPHNAHAI